MTRFARAHGSKSSNERLPEPATSWNVMKQQLKDKLQSSEDSTISSQKIWKSSDFDRDVWNKDEVKWADLGDSESADKAVKSGEKKNKKKENNKTITNEDFPQATEAKKKRKKKRGMDSVEFYDTQSAEIELTIPDGNFLHIGNAEKINKTKKKKKGADEVSNVSDVKLEKQTVIATNNTEHNVNKQRKQQQGSGLVTHEMSGDTICAENGTSPEFSVENNMKKKSGKKRKRSHDSISGIQDKQHTKKYRCELKVKEKVDFEESVALETSDQQLKKKHKHSKNEQNFSEENTDTVPGTDADVSPSEKHKKKKKHKANRGSNAVEDVGTNGKLNFQLDNSGPCTSIPPDHVQKKRKEKNMNDVWQQENNKKIIKRHDFSMEDRKKKNKFEKKYPHITILHMNGKDIEIVKFDGFPVKKDDAENLRQLKKKMIANGIPASEIKATMKLERRKAEKALAREKKKVCFHCRKSGHVLSECPELGKTETDDPIGTGICFKCGSTEHKHFECRVTREQEFRYAKCFICNEQGHIARQCPDNPRGLYPKGGGCHVCGDVTHLKKDCPDLIKEKEEKIIKLPTLSNKALEALEDDKNTKSVSSTNVNKKKTVKF